MTEVAFHFNAPDKLAYACRLLRKAVGSGARVVVTAPDEALARLNGLLWTFSQLDFIPHALASDPAHVRAASPILLTEGVEGLPHRQVLLNLGVEVPPGFDQFERLIEVVGLDDEDRALARGRWKHYTEQGYAITRHDLALKGGN
jgi:DNA polymerase-3 subunit chi